MSITKLCDTEFLWDRGDTPRNTPVIRHGNAGTERINEFRAFSWV